MVTYVRSEWLHMSDLNGYICHSQILGGYATAIHAKFQVLHMSDLNSYICHSHILGGYATAIHAKFQVFMIYIVKFY